MGGAGTESHENRERLRYDTHRAEHGDEASGATFPASGRPPRSGDVQPEGMKPDALTPENQPAASRHRTPIRGMPFPARRIRRRRLN